MDRAMCVISAAFTISRGPAALLPLAVGDYRLRELIFRATGLPRRRPGGRDKKGVGGMRAIVMSAAVVMGTLAYLMVGAALAGMG
jgi:hypothetical protein